MNLMEQFADPALMQQLPMASKMAGAGITAVMGMGVTFTVLFFLWGCIAIMSRFMHRDKRTPVPAITAHGESTPQSEQLTGSAYQTAPQHIAVIAAAVSAYEHRESGMKIRKIQRHSPLPAWADSIKERKVSR